MSDIHDVLSDALMLPDNDRRELAHQLLLSLNTELPSSELDIEWIAEIERRAADVDSGAVATRDIKEVIAEIRASLQGGTEK